MPKKIGRFEIIRVLGEGSQGIVHLARDPVLERRVAIKTLHTGTGQQASHLNDLLMDEAKVISKMTHPNIVSIFEAGEQKNVPFLVFEYVKGQTLSEVIRSKKYRKIADILSLFKPICLGIQHSHKNGIIHGDLKPANIIIDEENIPKVMDFGIARLLSEQKSKDNLYGTPRYMPPEYLRDREVSEANDVFAMGLILYELITGGPAFKGKDLKQIIYNVINSKVVLPTGYENKEVTDLFEQVILKATEKNRSNRFLSMGEMLSAIESYEKQQHVGEGQSDKAQDAAITFLMRKMNRKQDFPALSETLVKINSLVDQDETSAQELANVIAEDFALTNKILKLVNSAYYRGAKPEITTLSQAVLMLGFDAVRSVAVSLILIDHLHNKKQAKKMRSHIVSSIYSGVLTKDLSAEVQLGNFEEAFLSGTFHQLGELLALYYFQEEAEEIDKLRREQNLTEDQASRKILGVTYTKLALAIAEEWKLPRYILDNIPPYKVSDKKRKNLSDHDKLRAVTTLSNQLSNVLENQNDDRWRFNAVKLWKSFAKDLELPDDSMVKLADQARKNLVEVNSIYNIDLNNSDVVNKVRQLAYEEEGTGGADDKTLVIETTIVETSIVDEIRDPQEILEEAARDISDIFNSHYRLNDVLKTFADSVHEALDLERAIFCLYNRQNSEMSARYGLGITSSFLKQFSFFSNRGSNVFQVSVTKGVDIFINDTIEFEKKSALPPWYRQIIDAETFILLPFTINKKPFGLFYADKNKKNDLVVVQDLLQKVQDLRTLCTKGIEKRVPNR